MDIQDLQQVKLSKKYLENFRSIQLLINENLIKQFSHESFEYLTLKHINYKIDNSLDPFVSFFWDVDMADNSQSLFVDQNMLIAIPKIIYYSFSFATTDKIDEFYNKCFKKFPNDKLIFYYLEDENENMESKRISDELNLYNIMQYDTQFIFISSFNPDLLNLLYQITKSYAEAEKKLKLYDSKFAFHPAGEHTQSIKFPRVFDDKIIVKWKVDIWKAQLSSFNNVGKDVAEAIASFIPSPSSLLNAYQQIELKSNGNNLNTIKECENYLKDVNVRRGAGILQTTRRVGPELSKNIYKFFTSHEPLNQI
ncbi:unnamed protein product [Gordionus sp. m RMFG-2023]